jgi:hypothetical protein
MALRIARAALVLAVAVLAGVLALHRSPEPAEAVGPLTLPFPTTNYVVTQGYWTIPTAYHEGHPAYDLVPLDTSAITASAPGYATVRWDANCGPHPSQAQPNCDDNLCGAGESYGRWVDVDMGGGYHVLYTHLSGFVVADGTWVVRGQQVGVLGTAGCSTGPHIHFQVKHLTHSIDPGHPKLCDITTALFTTCPASLIPPSGHGLNVDGDGRDDVIVFNPQGHAVVARSNGAGFGGAADWGTVSTWGEIPGMGDFNGDGKHDAVTWNRFGNAIITLSVGTDFDSPHFWGNVFSWGEIPAAGDFNGDGKDDVVAFTPGGRANVSFNIGNGFTAASDWGYVIGWGDVPLTGDFNGDGRDDVVVFNYLGQAVVSLNVGASFGGVANWGNAFYWTEIPAVGDFNGDGKDDIVAFTPSGQAWVSLSTGAFLSSRTYWGTVLAWGQIPTVGDFNGDGKDDVATFVQDGRALVSLSNGSWFVGPAEWGHGFTWGSAPAGFQSLGWHMTFLDSDFDLRCNPGATPVICGGADNCPATYNPTQANFDGDPMGDACDNDDDADGSGDPEDACPIDPDPCGSVLGDADCDAQVNSADALRILRGAAQLPNAGGCVKTSGDVNCSGAVTAADALLLIRHIAGLPNTMPPGCPLIGT